PVRHDSPDGTGRSGQPAGDAFSREGLVSDPDRLRNRGLRERLPGGRDPADELQPGSAGAGARQLGMEPRFLVTAGAHYRPAGRAADPPPVQERRGAARPLVAGLAELENLAG